MPTPHADQAHRRRQGLRGGLALLRFALLFALLCTIILCAGLQWRAALEAGWGLTGPSPGAPTLGAAGVNASLEPLTPTERDAALSRLAEKQIGWVRQRLDWGLLEPEPGRYAWSESDAIIDAITRHGLEPVMVLDGSPAWARADVDRSPTDNPLAPPSDPANFARFAAAFADRYGDRVRYYQIWDEPNITPHWGSRHIEPVDYAQLLKAGATAIRSTDVDAIIIAAALAPTRDRGHTAMDEAYFLQRLYAAGAKSAMDVVAIQPLGFGYAPEHPSTGSGLRFQRAAWVRRTMQAAGDDETPLWAVRYGWNRDPHSPWGTVSADNQRRYAADALALAAARWPWMTGMAWAIDQPATPPDNLVDDSTDDPAWGFALDDALLTIIGEEARTTSPPSSAPPSPLAPLTRLTLLGLMAAVLAWRGWGSARLFAELTPLPIWLARYRQAPAAVHIAVWVLLLGVCYVATWPPLILLCWIVGALLMAAQPQVGLWLAVALLPFHFQHKELQLVNHVILIPPTQAALLALSPVLAHRARRWLVGPPAPNPGGESLAGVGSPQVGAGGRLKNRPLFDWLTLAWLAINLVAARNVWHWPAYWRGFMDLALTPVLLYGAIRLLIRDANGCKQAAAALYAGGVLAATVGLLTWLQGGGTDVDGLRRLVGPHFSPNHTALYLERTLFLGIGLLMAFRPANSRPRWRQVAISVSLFSVGLALLLTASRGAWLLGIPVGGALFLWLAWRLAPPVPNPGGDSLAGTHSPQVGELGWRRPWLIGIAIVILAVFALLAITPVWDRLGNRETVWHRFAIWQATADLWHALPLTGVGPGGFFWRYPAFIPMGSQIDPNLRHPHNVWLEMLNIWGALGLAWLLTALIAVWKSIDMHILGGDDDRGLTWIRIGLVTGLAAGLAHGHVDAFTALGDLAGWNWVVLALLVSPKSKEREQGG